MYVTVPHALVFLRGKEGGFAGVPTDRPPSPFRLPPPRTPTVRIVAALSSVPPLVLRHTWFDVRVITQRAECTLTRLGDIALYKVPSRHQRGKGRTSSSPQEIRSDQCFVGPLDPRRGPYASHGCRNTTKSDVESRRGGPSAAVSQTRDRSSSPASEGAAGPVRRSAPGAPSTS